MVDIPQPLAHKPEQRYAALMCELLAAQNDLLAEIRDRLPEPPVPDPAPERQVVELREPEAATAVPLTEPELRRKRGRPRKMTSAKEA